MTKFRNLLKSLTLFLKIGLFAILCSACTDNQPAVKVSSSPEKQPIQVDSPVSSHSARVRTPDSTTIISISSQETKEAQERGKELLKEYDVQYSQTIRFPVQDFVFRTHGAYALSSIKEAQSRYPDWPVPARLGQYRFVDFTLYHDRTSVVFPNTVPPPKDKIEILTDREPTQYYLCYQKGGNRFRINVIPILDEYEDEDFLGGVEWSEWPSHPRCYFDPAEENSATIFQSLWILPDADEKYAFFIHKISGPDCMESADIPFTDREAHALYQAIQKEFPG